MSDSVSACRAALLKTCYWQQDAPSEGGPSPEESTKPRTVFVDVDDAAACMAEREAKLRGTIANVGTLVAKLYEQATASPVHRVSVNAEVLFVALKEIHAVLAAAQGGTDA